MKTLEGQKISNIIDTFKHGLYAPALFMLLSGTPVATQAQSVKIENSDLLEQYDQKQLLESINQHISKYNINVKIITSQNITTLPLPTSSNPNDLVIRIGRQPNKVYDRIEVRRNIDGGWSKDTKLSQELVLTCQKIDKTGGTLTSEEIRNSISAFMGVLGSYITLEPATTIAEPISKNDEIVSNSLNTTKPDSDKPNPEESNETTDSTLVSSDPNQLMQSIKSISLSEFIDKNKKSLLLSLSSLLALIGSYFGIRKIRRKFGKNNTITLTLTSTPEVRLQQIDQALDRFVKNTGSQEQDLIVIYSNLVGVNLSDTLEIDKLKKLFNAQNINIPNIDNRILRTSFRSDIETHPLYLTLKKSPKLSDQDEKNKDNKEGNEGVYVDFVMVDNVNGKGEITSNSIVSEDSQNPNPISTSNIEDNTSKRQLSDLKKFDDEYSRLDVNDLLSDDVLKIMELNKELYNNLIEQSKNKNLDKAITKQLKVLLKSIGTKRLDDSTVALYLNAYLTTIESMLKPI